MRTLIAFVVGAILAVALIKVSPSKIREQQPVKWQHGFKTEHIIATVMRSQDLGENIKFEFPGKEYQCDRQEIMDYIKANGGFIFEGGGYPGAPIYAVFGGVTNRPSADQKLEQILPGFEKIVSKL